MAAKSHDIREWVRSTGRHIADRGPIPKDLRDDYDAYFGDDTGTDSPEAFEPVERVEETPPKIPTTGDLFLQVVHISKGL